MDAALPIVMRWLHIGGVIVLLGGVFYARYFADDLAPGFRKVGWITSAAILLSGLYNFFTKTSYPHLYHLWFGIKVLIALHIFTVVILYKGKRRLLTSAVFLGAVALALAEYLRWISLP